MGSELTANQKQWVDTLTNQMAGCKDVQRLCGYNNPISAEELANLKSKISTELSNRAIGSCPICLEKFGQEGKNIITPDNTAITVKIDSQTKGVTLHAFDKGWLEEWMELSNKNPSDNQGITHVFSNGRLNNPQEQIVAEERSGNIQRNNPLDRFSERERTFMDNFASSIEQHTELTNNTFLGEILRQQGLNNNDRTL